MPIKSNKELGLYTTLSMLFLVSLLATYVLAYKRFVFFDHISSAGIFTFTLCYAINDLVAELFGLSKARKMMFRTFIIGFIFSLLVSLLSHLPSPPTWGKIHDPYYQFILGQTVRFSISNGIAVFIGMNINSYFISKWKLLLAGRFFMLRSIGATAIGELITTIVADHLEFLGTMPYKTLVSIMITLYIIKIVAAIVYAPFIATYARIAKRKYKIDHYDTQFKFNPFSLN